MWLMFTKPTRLETSEIEFAKGSCPGTHPLLDPAQKQLWARRPDLHLVWEQRVCWFGSVCLWAGLCWTHAGSLALAIFVFSLHFAPAGWLQHLFVNSSSFLPSLTPFLSSFLPFFLTLFLPQVNHIYLAPLPHSSWWVSALCLPSTLPQVQAPRNWREFLADDHPQGIAQQQTETHRGSS